MKRGLAVGALLACAPSLAAQDASVLLGGSHARYADSLEGTAGLLGIRLGVGRGLRAAQVDAALARFTAGGWAIQASGHGSALWPAGRGRVSLGFAAGASLNHVGGGSVTGTGAGGPMLALHASRTQLTAGAAAGTYRSLDGAWRGIGSGALRGHWAPHPQVLLGLAGTGILADTLRFTDLSAQVRLEHGPLRVGAVGGARVGDLADGAWGSADLSVELWRRLVIEASAGRYPPDVTGFTDGLYAQVGIRVFALRTPAPIRLPRPAVEVRRLDAARVRVEVRCRTAATELAIAGDWNGWTPTPMRRAGDSRWVADLEVGPGAWGYALIADGEWVLPDGVPGVDDGFGGRVARLMVPR